MRVTGTVGSKVEYFFDGVEIWKHPTWFLGRDCSWWTWQCCLRYSKCVIFPLRNVTLVVRSRSLTRFNLTPGMYQAFGLAGYHHGLLTWRSTHGLRGWLVWSQSRYGFKPTGFNSHGSRVFLDCWQPVCLLESEECLFVNLAQSLLKQIAISITHTSWQPRSQGPISSWIWIFLFVCFFLVCS